MRTALLVCGLGLAASSWGTIDYTVRVAEGADHLMVEMVIPSDGKPVQVQIPNWAPGSYRLVNNFSFIFDVTAMRSSRRVGVTRVDDNTWEVGAGVKGDVILRYQRKTGPVANRMHVTGPAHYLYVKGRVPEACTLKYELPQGWRSTCGLDVKGDRFVAPSYDVLADNPVTIGVFESDHYEFDGVKHEIAYFGGDVSKVDRRAVVEYCRKITEGQNDFWKGLPFSKYVWHFTVMPTQDGGWGLEHLSSTTIGLAQGLGKGTVSVMSHEYFHAWNVKRIRSKVLGPFDYLVLPKTGALWLLEGVTDYYANLLLYRYDVFDEAYMKDEIIGNVRTTRANPARFEVSPYDSSYRVGEAANGRGNSAGFGVNYYNTGWLVGLCLDLEIRDRTKGAKSLDDLMYALYEQCKDDRAGFEEDDIRKHLIKIAGEGMGEVYDQWVMSPGELPVESQLRKVGYEMKSTVTKFADVGFPLNWADGKVTATTGNRSGQVRSGDEIVEINGVGKGSTPESSAQVWGQWRTMLVPGSRVNLVLMRGSERVELSVDVVETTRTAYSIEDGSLNDSLRTLRQGWWKGGRKLW